MPVATQLRALAVPLPSLDIPGRLKGYTGRRLNAVKWYHTVSQLQGLKADARETNVAKLVLVTMHRGFILKCGTHKL